MDWELKMPPWDLSELDQATTEPNMGPIGPGGGLDCSVDLKLGGLGDFAAAAAASSSVSAAKRARQQRSGGGGSSSSSQNAAACSVDGCRADLSSCRDYHRRHKVCEAHSKTPIVVVGGQEQRFCQQCSRFHLLVEFDDVKRSCRKRLDGHNRRRRKPQSNHINSGNLFTNHHEGNNNRFSSYPHVYQAAVSDPAWPVNMKSEEESLFNHHTVQVHFLDRQQQQHRHHHFSNSFPLSFKEGKHFPFLQDSTDRATTVETSSICQPLLKTISSAESSNNNHNHNNTSNKFFADGLSRVLDSDCALSLLSSPPQSSSAINLGHTAAPSVDRIPICQPLISYGGGGLELGRYSGASNHVSVSATGFSYSGMEDENNVVGGSTTVLVSDASDPEMSCQELFGVVGCEGSSDGGSQTLPFSWGSNIRASMASSLSRIARKTLTLTPNLLRSLSTTTASATAPPPLPPPVSSSPSSSHVKWDYRGQRRIIPLGQWLPKIAVDAYVAPNVVLAGQVTVWDGASVWNGAVLRGDLNKITVGFCSNIQERCVLHAAWSSPTGLPAETSIERYVTVGAYSLLRSCTIEPECIIGQHSILMEGSLVETNSILEAGSVLPPGRRIPTGELWAGNPARFVRKLTHEEIVEIPKLAVAINDLMQSHFSEFLPYSTVYLEVEKLKKELSIPI